MRVWKLQVCHDTDAHVSTWGYAFAATHDEALKAAISSRPGLVHRAYEKPEAMLWPGAPDSDIFWPGDHRHSTV